VKEVIVSTVVAILWWLFATACVNLVAHKSQVNEWCEKRPRLAGLLKLMRGVGCDPWLLLQAVTLWVKGRLPEKLRDNLPVFLVALSALLVAGCAGTFEEAKLAGINRAVPVSDVEYCRELDSSRITWGAIAKGSLLAASASGISMIPVESKTAEIAIASGVVAFGTLGVSAIVVSEGKGEAWARDCSR
jgi:hypothetical protein